MTIVHEYWIPLDEDKQQLQEAFDILDPQQKSRLMVDEFVYLLKNSGWPDEEIELLLSQVSCGDGYFLHDGNKHCVFVYSKYQFSFHIVRFTKNSSDTS